jgi:hypothetical protein
MQHRTIRGYVRYLGDTVGERGREWFTVTVHGNGHRTMRAQCEMEDSGVLRDVTFAVNERFQPLDAFIRLSVKDQFMGSGWFRFADNFAECEVITADAGRISQRFDLGGRAPSFGAHPVACDIWHLPQFDRSRGPRKEVIAGVLMSSNLPNGASGPLLAFYPDGLPIRYVGPETVTVPAGTFETEHFIFEKDGRPPQHCWCMVPDFTIVKIRSELLKTTYELMEYSDTAGRKTSGI